MYDIEKALRAVEDELMQSMLRNMKRHRMEEIDEKKEWEMWQALQLKSLEEYKKENRKKFQSSFSRIDKEIAAIISEARAQGNMEQEIKILEAIRKGFKPPKGLKNSTQTMGEFFRLNDRKLNALIKATQNDFKKAEQAVLRMSEDQYRQVIFNAQVYANTGAGTYEKAVDMATKDFLNRGINCIEYANGARHTIADYADMAIRTAVKRAYLTGEGEKRKEWGITTVIVNKRGNACPKCLPFVGKVLIDDVWSGGKQSDGPYMLMSYAMSQGLYHPRCRDVHTTYFEGISTPGAAYTKEELAKIEKDYRKEQKQQYANRQAERFGRLAKYSLDEENKKKYKRKENEWEKVVESDNTGQARTNGENIETVIEEKHGVKVDISQSGQYKENARQSLIALNNLLDEYNSTMVGFSIEPSSRVFGEAGSAYMVNGKTSVKVKASALRGKSATDDLGVGNKSHLSVTYHEFAHTLSQSREKVDNDFWKEIRAIRREYNQQRGTSSWFNLKISSYADTDLDEFFAEAFTQAKLSESPSEYSRKVLEVTDKYFKKSVVNISDYDIMELQRKSVSTRENLKFITDETFNNLTIAARKKGAVIIRGTKEVEEHLERMGAAASNIGDVLLFRKDVCISEVLEETYHFEQNLSKMNYEREEPLRSILNEIDAKQYLLNNADKYKIPRNETELTKKQLESYQKQLEKYDKEGV